MKSRLLTIVYLSLFLLPGMAQVSVVDSLKEELRKRPAIDEQAVLLKIALAESYRSISIEEAIRAGMQSLDDAQRLNIPYLTFKAHMSLGVTYILQLHYHTAIEQFYSALEVANKNEGYDWKKRKAQAMINISGVLYANKDVASAQKYHRSSMKILRELNEPIVLADNYLGGAFFYIELQQYDSATLYLNEALKIYEGEKEDSKAATAYSKLGDVMMLQGKFDEALKYALRSLDIRTTINDPVNIPWSHLLAGKVYQVKELDEKAIDHFRKADRLFQKTGEKEGLIDLYPQMVAFFEKNNLPDSALFYLKNYQQYLKDIYDEAKNKQIQQLEFEYQSKEKEQENQLLRQQNTAARFRNIIFGLAAVAFLSVTLLLSWFFMRLRQKKEMLQALNIKLQAANQNLQQLHNEKKFLASLLTHDLRHPLAIIQLNLHELQHTGFSPELLDEMQHAADRIDEMSRRIMDVENMEEGITLSLQLADVDGLAALESARNEFLKYAERRAIDLQIQANPGARFVRADAYFLQRILGNLLSNAIKYSPEGAPIVMSIEDAGDNIQFLVADKGPGLDAEDRSKVFQFLQRLKPQAIHGESSWGYGLFIAKRYAEAMQGSLEVRSEKGKGSTFTLVLQKVVNSEQ